MSGTAMVVAIVFISVGFGVLSSMYSQYIKFKSRSIKNDAQLDAKFADMEKAHAELKERIKVLETIVTDEGYRVKKEISNL